MSLSFRSELRNVYLNFKTDSLLEGESQGSTLSRVTARALFGVNNNDQIAAAGHGMFMSFGRRLEY